MDQIIQAIGHVLRDLRDARWDLEDDLGQHRHRIRADEGRTAGQALEEDAAE